MPPNNNDSVDEYGYSRGQNNNNNGYNNSGGGFDPMDPSSLIRDPMYNSNMFRPDIQPDFYMAKELLADDFADSIRARLDGYEWDEITVNSINTFLDYLKSQAVVLANYNDRLAMRRAVLNVKIAFLKQMLLANRADTNSSEYLAIKDYCFQYLEDKLSRTVGVDRERILHDPRRQIVDQKVQHEISSRGIITQSTGHTGFADRFKRKPRKEYEE